MHMDPSVEYISRDHMMVLFGITLGIGLFIMTHGVLLVSN